MGAKRHLILLCLTLLIAVPAQAACPLQHASTFDESAWHEVLASALDPDGRLVVTACRHTD